MTPEIPNPDEYMLNVRMQWAIQSDTWRDLVQKSGLTREGLNWVRNQLRNNWSDLWHPADREARALLLDAVCRRLADNNEGRLEYYIGIGDVLPDIPDSPHEIVGPIG